jgi:ribose 5-phosphate isomerase RpiB
VVSLGSRMHSPAQAARLVEICLAAPFNQGDRHRRRIELIAADEVSR